MKTLHDNQLNQVSGGALVDWVLPDGVTYDQIAPFLNGELPDNWEDVLDETDSDIAWFDDNGNDNIVIRWELPYV